MCVKERGQDKVCVRVCVSLSKKLARRRDHLRDGWVDTQISQVGQDLIANGVDLLLMMMMMCRMVTYAKKKNELDRICIATLQMPFISSQDTHRIGRGVRLTSTAILFFLTKFMSSGYLYNAKPCPGKEQTIITH